MEQTIKKNDLQQAKQILAGGMASCVLVKDGEVVLSSERGIRPLLQFVDSGKDFSGFAAADRIVGKAAAMLYQLLGVSSVYADVMSVEGKDLLTEAGIETSCRKLTDAIRGRGDQAVCPMDEAVKGITDPEEAYRSLVAAVSAMQTQKA